MKLLTPEQQLKEKRPGMPENLKRIHEQQRQKPFFINRYPSGLAVSSFPQVSLYLPIYSGTDSP